LTDPIISASAGDAEGRIADWLQTLGNRVPALGVMLGRSTSDQLELGYYHTLREICQQPITWPATAGLAASSAAMLAEAVRGVRHIVLTGSGSSLYAAECLALKLQVSLGISAQSIASGQLLTHGKRALPPSESLLLMSLARSGDSPESYAIVRETLASQPNCRHLIVTCNQNGRLARCFTDEPRVRTLTLAPEVCDRSLVMTSSFTNMAVAGWALASLGDLPKYRQIVGEIARAGSHLLLHDTDALAAVARQPYTSAVYLASGGRLGAANECALKMLESTAGRVHTFAETYLGLRHGPMSAVHDDTLVVCLLSSDPQVRPYELDLIAELNRKRIGGTRLILGSTVPRELLATVLDAMAGQLLAFFRCLQEGLHPDSPSSGGIINRVVEKFTTYGDDSETPA
jgi:tagatose-6-phosphate ketose/aldose isomerase